MMLNPKQYIAAHPARSPSIPSIQFIEFETPTNHIHVNKILKKLGRNISEIARIVGTTNNDGSSGVRAETDQTNVSIIDLLDDE